MSPKLHDRRRLLGLAIFVFLLFSALIAQYFHLQVVQNDHWTRVGQAQHEGIVTEPFRRGTLWSNPHLKQGHPAMAQPLTLDLPKFHLHIDPLAIPEEHRKEIAEILDVSEEPFAKRSRNRRLTMWLDREEREEILTWWRPYARAKKIAPNALFFVRDYQRSYPYGAMLGQVLHTIRDFKDEEQQGVPTGGLESQFNSLLKGKPGKRWVLRSPRQPLSPGVVIEEARDGADIYLSIDSTLQAICEEEIAIAVERAEAKSGWAIMMNPHTGEILAWAQTPSFDPRNYRDYFNDPERIPDTLVKGISYAFEPGSTMKPITAAIALLAGFDPDERIDTADGRFPGRSRPITEVRNHGNINMDMAIQKSSNIYVARLVQRMDERWYLDQLRRFGFGKRTGIELPSETPGVLPGPGDSGYSRCAPFSMAMGYNLQVNSLQMLSAYAVIVNGGFQVKPTLLAGGKPGTRILPESVSRRVCEAMRYATGAGGCARRAAISGYTEMGKTGTTEKLVDGKYAKNVHFSSLIGAVPAEQPELLLMIAIDEPCHSLRYGGLCSGPAFRAIATRSLDYLGVPRDDPDNSAWKPQIAQLREIYTRWNTPAR